MGDDTSCAVAGRRRRRWPSRLRRPIEWFCHRNSSLWLNSAIWRLFARIVAVHSLSRIGPEGAMCAGCRRRPHKNSIRNMTPHKNILRICEDFLGTALIWRNLPRRAAAPEAGSPRPARSPATDLFRPKFQFAAQLAHQHAKILDILDIGRAPDFPSNADGSTTLPACITRKRSRLNSLGER